MIKYITNVILYIISLFTNRYKNVYYDTLDSSIYKLMSTDINIYKIKSTDTIRFCNKDIITSITFIEYLLTKDFDNTYVNDLLSYNYTYCKLNEWYTNDLHMINKLHLYKWLKLCSELNIIYKRGMSNDKTGKIYSNSIKLKPYIINIEEIVAEILKHTNNDI